MTHFLKLWVEGFAANPDRVRKREGQNRKQLSSVEANFTCHNCHLELDQKRYITLWIFWLEIQIYCHPSDESKVFPVIVLNENISGVYYYKMCGDKAVLISITFFMFSMVSRVTGPGSRKYSPLVLSDDSVFNMVLNYLTGVSRVIFCCLVLIRKI